MNQMLIDFASARKRRQRPVYYPTTPLSAEQLAGAIRVAENQDEAVLAIFRRYAGHDLTPSRVWQIGVDGGRQWLLTSVRRSITNLTDDSYLEKCGHAVMGMYSKPEHAWRLWQPGRAA